MPRRAGDDHGDVSRDSPGRLDLQKKTLAAREQDPAVRAAFAAQLSQLDPARVVAVDETGATITLTRRYARAPHNQRARGQVPKNYGKTTTLVTALTVDGFGPALTLTGALNTAAFRVYIRDLLAPTLQPGQVVVLDNLPSHHAADITDLIAERGCEVLFLPPYSPDFNPIELAFAKVKARLRAAEPRTPQALAAAISQSIDCVTPKEAKAFFRHCGYQSPASS